MQDKRLEIEETKDDSVQRLEGELKMDVTNELDSTCGISDDELTRRFEESIRIDNEIRKIKGLPIPKYDSKAKRAYLEYPDGRKEYAGKGK